MIKSRLCLNIVLVLFLKSFYFTEMFTGRTKTLLAFD